MSLPFEQPLRAGYAEVDETVVIQAPPEHDLAGELEFTYWKDGSVTVELRFEEDARVERAEIDDHVVHLQIGRRFA